MNILMAFESEYRKPAMVTMYSLLCNNDRDITFYIIYSRLTKEERLLLTELAESTGHGSCVFLPVPEEAYRDLPTFFWISAETYYRLMAQKLLPESVDRILWLDADIVVCGDITEFYDQDFEGNLLVACSVWEEGVVRAQLNQLTLPPDARYFNAGVLLYNMTAQRKQLDPEVYTEYLKVFGNRLVYADQDVLNAVFYRCVKFADQLQYNCFTNALDQYPPAKRRTLLKQCRILHYNGSSKPWNKEYCFLGSHIFRKYALSFPEYSYLTDPDWRKQEDKARRRHLYDKKKMGKKEQSILRYSFVMEIAGKKVRVIHQYQKVLNHCKKYLTASKDADLEISVTESDLEYEKKQYEAACRAENREFSAISKEELEVAAVNRRLADVLLDFNTVLVHGAAAGVDGQAYLFCAKSGVGKTTHINLWREVLGDRLTIINGDKPFLQIGEKITVYVSPWCGKEGENTNCAYPLAAICLIKRGAKNEIRKISQDEAFVLMMSHIYRFREQEKAKKLLTLVAALCETLPVYELTALPNADAARLSYETMTMGRSK